MPSMLSQMSWTEIDRYIIAVGERLVALMSTIERNN